MNFLIQILTWLNVPMNTIGGFLSGFLSSVPGWVSNTIIAAVAGPILLLVFKYTSNQSAIGRAKNTFKANMLALKLYKDSFGVTMLSLGRVLKAAFLRLGLAMQPLAVIIIPVSLLLAQMGLWYQFRPFVPGEETIITMKLNNSTDSSLPEVTIEPTETIEITTGPIRTPPKGQIVWKVKAGEQGSHKVIFNVDNQKIEKQFDIGAGLMRISPMRPGRQFGNIILYPAEKPFTADSVVQSISIDYPGRVSKISGAGWWMIYFFVVSMLVALIFIPVFKVKI